MKNLINGVIFVLTVFTSGYANSTSVYLDLPAINFTSPTTEDYIVANISGNYATPGYLLNTSPDVNVVTGGIEIIFDVSAPTGIVPFVLDPFSYFVDVGQLPAGDWYLTPIFYVDGVFDSTFNTVLPLFTVTAVPVPAALWLFGSGLVGLLGVARHKARI